MSCLVFLRYPLGDREMFFKLIFGILGLLGVGAWIHNVCYQNKLWEQMAQAQMNGIDAFAQMMTDGNELDDE